MSCCGSSITRMTLIGSEPAPSSNALTWHFLGVEPMHVAPPLGRVNTLSLRKGIANSRWRERCSGSQLRALARGYLRSEEPFYRDPAYWEGAACLRQARQ